MLARHPLEEDLVAAQMFGISLPERGMPYTVAEGPCIMHNERGSVTVIVIEELGEWEWNTEYFIEVQEPMDVTRLLGSC